MTTTPRKLLQLDRFQCEGGAGLRIESTWNRRAVFVLDAKEAEELCLEIQRLFPEHFPAPRDDGAQFRQAGRVDL